MKNVLITGSLPDSIKQKLQNLGLEISHYGVNDLVEPQKFKEAIAHSDIYISGGYEEGKADIIEAARNLKLIAFLGVDAGHFIDIPTCTNKQVKVCNTPGANAISVAEFTFGLMLDAHRRITQCANATMIPEHNSGYSYATSRTLYGKTIGLIGFGRIAQHLAKMAINGFGAKILYNTQSGAKPDLEPAGAKFASMEELVSESDIISLHVPRHAGSMLNKKQFDKMKPGITIVNTCAAENCDANALLELLKRDSNAYCAFDGFYEEADEQSKQAIDELRKMFFTQFVVTPHVAWRTHESDLATLDMAVESIADAIAGKSPRNLLN